MPGPVRKSDTDTSLSEVMKARMKAAITPARTFGSTMVKKVFTGGAAEADRRLLDGEVEGGEARADHAHHIGQHDQRMADQKSDAKIGAPVPTVSDFSRAKPNTISGTRIGSTNSVPSQFGSSIRKRLSA